MEELLTKINMSEYIDIFQEHGIDTDMLFEMGEEEIKEIFPKIGHRIKFKKGIEKLKNESSTNNIPVTYVDNYFIKTLSSELTRAEETQADEIRRDETRPDETRAEENKNSYEGEESEFETSLSFKNENPVFKILNATLDGRAILRDGLVGGGLLKEGSRRKLSQLLIHEVLEKNSFKAINNEEFKKLATNICSLFPKESHAVYYSAYVSSSNGGTRKNSSGKLYESYISRRRKLRESGLLPGTSRSSSRASISSTTTSTTSSAVDLCEDFKDFYEENLTFLKNSIEPWTVIEKKWSQTREYRVKLTNTEGNIGDYFKDFPALKQPQGYTLLLQDFSHQYSGKETILHSALASKREDIISYGKNKLMTTRDKFLKAKIYDLINLVDDAIPETSTNVAIGLLPLIINISAARKQKNKPTWKPSRAEIADSFIAQAATEGDVTALILARREAVGNLGRTLQPFIIIVGKSFVILSKAYVVIDNTLYEFQKLITAIDCAFKIFHATGACYPEESQDIWTFIQLGFYDIQTKFDRCTQAVNTLLTDLELN